MRCSLSLLTSALNQEEIGGFNFIIGLEGKELLPGRKSKCRTGMASFRQGRRIRRAETELVVSASGRGHRAYGMMTFSLATKLISWPIHHVA